MNPMILRLAAFAALAATASVTSCSSTPAQEVAYVNATLNNGNSQTCNLGLTPIVSVGDGTDPTSPPTTVVNGDHGLTIDCTVAPNGGAFNVQLSAHTNAGTFALTGQADSNGGSKMTGFFLNSQASFRSTNCVLTYVYATLNNEKSPGIAAGSVAGHVECDDAMSTTGLRVGNSVATCQAMADFEFQNCNQ